MNPLSEIGLSTLLGLAFGAGGAWFLIKQSRKDVNGLGRRLNQEVKKLDNIIVALMLITPDEVKRDVAKILTTKEDVNL